MRTLLAATATAASALLAAPALAEGPVFPDAGIGERQGYLASELMGTRLLVTDAPVAADAVLPPGGAAAFDDVGEIDDVFIGAGGGFEAVIVNVGGFLGVGEREVAVAWTAIVPVREGDDPGEVFLVLPTTREALRAAPEFRRAAPGGVLVRGEGAADALAEEPFEAEAAHDAAELRALNAEVEAAEASAAEAADMADAAPLAAAPPTVDPLAPGAVVEEEVLPRATDPRTLPEPVLGRDGYEVVGRDALTAADLEGLRVFGANDEDVGAVEEVVVTPEGLPDRLVLEIGGFLGIGRHPVAVSLDEVRVLRSGSDVRVHVDATREQLEALPEYVR
ncbi:PRC-barrel domain protein [Hasllibacter halocynthiae]|uniref:PRC-barrel domain protein n=1 Tax=Hasllibacter halocynthiae TaxID=595589 RepID=A0A2T0X486_9RHOB|nr:PRC-barrel domain-containing protein [Hasllibacter halocynthiae]PRY93758.1 PRC-barrel domain protein [Hasllibacter halocynthiae]